MRSSPGNRCCRTCSSTPDIHRTLENAMRYLHAMVRVRDLDASLEFFREGLGLVETRRKDYPQGRFTLVYLGAPENPEAEIGLPWNYDDEDSPDMLGLGTARNFGHL